MLAGIDSHSVARLGIVRRKVRPMRGRLFSRATPASIRHDLHSCMARMKGVGRSGVTRAPPRCWVHRLVQTSERPSRPRPGRTIVAGGCGSSLTGAVQQRPRLDDRTTDDRGRYARTGPMSSALGAGERRCLRAALRVTPTLLDRMAVCRIFLRPCYPTAGHERGWRFVRPPSERTTGAFAQSWVPAPGSFRSSRRTATGSG